MKNNWFQNLKEAFTDYLHETEWFDRLTPDDLPIDGSTESLQAIVDSFGYSNALPFNRVQEYAPSQLKHSELFPSQQRFGFLPSILINTIIGIVTGHILATAAIANLPAPPWDYVVYGSFLIASIAFWNLTAYSAMQKMRVREHKVRPVMVTAYPRPGVYTSNEHGKTYYVQVDSQKFNVKYSDYKRYKKLQDTLLNFYLSPSVMPEWQSSVLRQKYAGILSCELASS